MHNGIFTHIVVGQKVAFLEEEKKYVGTVQEIEATKCAAFSRGNECQIRINLDNDPKKIGFRYRRPKEIELA